MIRLEVGNRVITYKWAVVLQWESIEKGTANEYIFRDENCLPIIVITPDKIHMAEKLLDKVKELAGNRKKPVMIRITDEPYNWEKEGKQIVVFL